MTQKAKICFISETSRDVLLGRGKLVGGAEVQLSVLAKELVKKSYDVSFITFGKTGDFFEISEGVKVYKAFHPVFEGYSFLLPQNLYSLYKILRIIDADVYIKKGRSPLTGVISFIAKLQKKIFIFIASSEKDVSKHLALSTLSDLSNIFFRFGVLHSDRVVCQTEHEKSLLKQHCGRNGVLIKNIYLPPKKETLTEHPNQNKILWVGRLIQGKRPELYLELAKKLPDYRFQIIITATKLNMDYYEKIKKAVEKIKNIDFIGFVPYASINKYYEQSSMLVSTSISEGFPNTFLEAWGNSIPVVSIGFDPDEIICKNELGKHTENFEDLVNTVDMLIKNESLRKKMGMQGRRYIETEHNVIKIVDEYEKLINFSLKIKQRIPEG